MPDDCFERSMKLGVAIEMTQSTAINIFTALVFPLSTFIADKVYILTTGSYNIFSILF